MLSIHNLPDSIDRKTAPKSKREKKRRKTTITQSNWPLCSCPVASLSALCTHEINQLIVKLSNQIKFCFEYFFLLFRSSDFKCVILVVRAAWYPRKVDFVRFIFLFTVFRYKRRPEKPQRKYDFVFLIPFFFVHRASDIRYKWRNSSFFFSCCWEIHFCGSYFSDGFVIVFNFQVVY